MMNRSITIATGVEPRIWATAAWVRPMRDVTIRTAAIVSGILAIAVRRWWMKCQVPDFAEPRPRARPSAVRMFMGSSSQPAHQPSADDPQDDRQHDGPDQVGARKPFAFGWPEARPGVPDQMPHSAKHVMDQRP